METIDADPLLRTDPDPGRTGGPTTPEVNGVADCVWLTAESLGDADPALEARTGLPAVFVFDAPLLDRLQLSAKRLVFLAECLADLAERRPLTVYRGAPADVLAGRRLAVTFTPVPGWRRLAARLDVAELHSWRWLRYPHGGSVASFSAWRRSLDG
jgi:deoxyribodipyrimidine photo-lyase